MPLGRRRVPVLLPVVPQEQPVHRVVSAMRRPPTGRPSSRSTGAKRAGPMPCGPDRVHQTAVRVVGRWSDSANRHQQSPDAGRRQGDRDQGGR